MLRIIILATAIMSLLAGCTTLTDSGPMAVSPPSASGGKWTITAKSSTGWFYDDITLFVNGEQVATGSLGPSSHRDVHISGDYQHHIVLGICSRTDSDPPVYSCDIYVDGSALSTLHWQG